MAICRTTFAATLLIPLIVTCSTAQAEIKGEAIRIGVLTDMNGAFATAMGPGSVEAARMAAEEFRRQDQRQADRDLAGRPSEQAGYRCVPRLQMVQ
jgi:hypothetical protein